MFWDEEAVRQGVIRETVEAEAQFDPAAFGARLRTARMRANLSQVDMSTLLDVSQATYSRMENGRIEPSRVTSTLLERASLAVSRSMTWLLLGSPVRDRVRLAARRTDEQDVRTQADRALGLLELDAELDDIVEFADLGPGVVDGAVWQQFVEAMPHASRRQGKERADHLRNALGLGIEPLNDIPAVLEQDLEVDAAVLDFPDGLSAVVAFDDERALALLAVSAAEPWVRQRFSFTHELAHVLFADGHAYDHDHRHSPTEMRAEKFAQNFLIPEGGIRAWMADNGYGTDDHVSRDDACRLADLYGVSPTTAWIALADINVAPKGPAPTSAGAAVVAGMLARYQARERNCHVERVPVRMERRILKAFRSGFLSAAATANALGQDASVLSEASAIIDDEPRTRGASGVPNLA
ncbi:helix-turn-helix domain-containing protein [Kribbella sp. NPDC051620]|uniref:helix-turn-helix domain-containing protein n=1 Tax=Kribbella sp. NPDC051620 TaxID=3364120 RepID=UPI00379DAEE4